MRFVIVGLLLFTSAFGAFAQSNILRFTDYSMVQPIINPSCMGLEDGIGGLLLYRSRFEKSDYWPSTGVFNINAGMPHKNLGGGINLVFDKYGPYSKLNAYVAGSYKLKVNEGKYLFFGLQAGVNYVSNEGNYKKADDEIIFSDNYSQPNFGVGLHFQTDKFFVGASVPEFRYNTIDEEGNKINDLMSDMLKMFFYGGYRFSVGQNTELLPYSYLTYSGEEGTTLDLGIKLLYKKSLEFGLQYRTEEAFAAMVKVRWANELWLGYSFEGNNSDIDNSFNSVQEIGLTFRFGKKGKKSSVSEEKYDENINSIRYF